MKRTDCLSSLLPAGLLLFLLLCFPREMTQGVRDALHVCGTALIPSLFPFFVLCTFTVKSGLADRLGKPAERVMRILFRLPGPAAPAVLLGLCGGYPVGTRMTAQLYEKGALTKTQAERMCLFCVSAGPAFTVGTVGAGLLGSRSAGRVLFFALTLSALTTGLLLRFADTPAAPRVLPVNRTAGVTRSFCESVADAGESILSVCAWVLLFSGVGAAAAKLPEALAVPLACLLEVTNGCRMAASHALSLPLIAAVLGFGGFAVHCQVLPSVSACGVRVSRFLAFRAVHASLCALYCEVLLRLFPQVQPVILLQNGARLLPYSASAPASAALLATAAVFIWQTSEPKTNNSNKKLNKILKNVKKTT